MWHWVVTVVRDCSRLFHSFVLRFVFVLLSLCFACLPACVLTCGFACYFLFVRVIPQGRFLFWSPRVQEPQQPADFRASGAPFCIVLLVNV